MREAPGSAGGGARPRCIAVTGATGFIGCHLLDVLAARGCHVRALARARRGRDLADRAALRWVVGDLDTPAALSELCDGADAVVHLAGATKAVSAAAFRHVNAEAAGRVAKIAGQAGAGRFIHLSSLAATRPDVSDYASSKAAGEAAVRENAGSAAVTIVRAPAVIGAGDSATAPLFRALAKGWLPVPGGVARGARFSIVDVDDLCEFLAGLAGAGADAGESRPGCVAPYGHEALGWSDIAASAARVTGATVRQIVVPGPVFAALGLGADLAARLTRRAQVFSSGKVREMMAGDWIADTPLSNPTPLDVTLQHCLAPFAGSGNVGGATDSDPDRSPE